MNSTQATLTCPRCQAHQLENMPPDSCVPFYKCQSCGETIQAKEGDCCVFCSYSDQTCPLKGNA